MTSSRVGALLIVVVVSASGCGDSHEAVTREMLSTQKELRAILDEVQDDASARAALPRVKEIAVRMEKLRHRSDALGAPPAEIRSLLHTKYQQEIRQTTEAIRRNFTRMDPLQALQLQDALNTVPPAPEK